MRLGMIKAIVFGLGVAILVVFGLIVMTLLGGRSDGDADRATADRVASDRDRPARTAARGPHRVELPAGARVVETGSGDGRIVLRLRLDGGEERVLLIDPRNGAIESELILQPGVPR